MGLKEIRLLKASEIEVRVQSVKKTTKSVGAILLLYKNARVDMNILDEIYGPTGWQREHELINGNLFCTISIWDDEKKQWIKKQDVGVESYTEKEKGQASDSFKRAGFNVGIGRELYTAPFIWINLNEGEYNKTTDTRTKKDKYNLSPIIKFNVKSIEYNEDKEISKLEIQDNHNKIRYTLSKNTIQTNTATNTTKPAVTGSKTSFTLKCEKCGMEISEKVANYSKSKIGNALCMNCQSAYQKNK